MAQIHTQGQVWPRALQPPRCLSALGLYPAVYFHTLLLGWLSAEGFRVQVCDRLREVSHSSLGDSRGACAQVCGGVRGETQEQNGEVGSGRVPPQVLPSGSPREGSQPEGLSRRRPGEYMISGSGNPGLEPAQQNSCPLSVSKCTEQLL